ncbi:unnamed protein product, partial [Urochloa humidicola]
NGVGDGQNREQPSFLPASPPFDPDSAPLFAFGVLAGGEREWAGPFCSSALALVVLVVIRCSPRWEGPPLLLLPPSCSSFSSLSSSVAWDLSEPPTGSGAPLFINIFGSPVKHSLDVTLNHLKPSHSEALPHRSQAYVTPLETTAGDLLFGVGHGSVLSEDFVVIGSSLGGGRARFKLAAPNIIYMDVYK